MYSKIYDVKILIAAVGATLISLPSFSVGRTLGAESDWEVSRKSTKKKSSSMVSGYRNNDETKKTNTYYPTSEGDSTEKPKTKVLSAEGLNVKEDIKVEFGEGVAETEESALQEAMRDVLQKVVGVYVDSDFRMKNDEIIKDEIVTHSNGFIDHYKILESNNAQDGRGIHVTIKAWVKMRDFVNRMKKIEPKQVVKVDGVLLQSDLGNRLNAEALLEKELGDLNPVLDLMQIRILDNHRPEIQASTGNSVTLRYVFQIKYSKDKYYKQFLPRITSVLDQICEKRLKDRVVPMKVINVDSFPLQIRRGQYTETEPHKGTSVPTCCLVCQTMWKGRNKNSISIVTRMSKSGAATSREWLLSDRLKKVFMGFLERNDRYGFKADCVLRLRDAQGEDLGVGTVEICQDDLLVYRIYNSDYNDYGGTPEFIPLIKAHVYPDYEVSEECWKKLQNSIIEQRWSGYHMFSDRYIGYVDVTIARSDVSKIKSAEIKLETRSNKYE